MDIVSIIQAQYMSFSPKEKLIADYVLEEKSRLESVNISVLAKAAGVSPGMITRFCKKIGCPTFTDFKLRLSRVKAGKVISNSDEPLRRVYEFYREMIEDTDKMMSRSSLEHIASEIKRAGYIYVYGIGNSGLTANELLLRLMRMGFRGQCLSDPHLMLMNSTILSKNDLIIAFSVSGETVEIVHAAAVARTCGCRVLSLTSFAGSHLSQNSDVSFTVPNSQLVDRDIFFNSQFAFLYVIDLLTTTLLQDQALKRKFALTIETILEQNKKQRLN